MESKTSSGQILIECALGMMALALLFAALLEFNTPKRGYNKRQIINARQVSDFREFRNGK